MIKIEGLAKSFGSFYALREVSLEIHAGEYWMIVGPNGAGKTTLLKIIATLSQPSAGKIEIQDFSWGPGRGFNRRQSAADGIPPVPSSNGGTVELQTAGGTDKLRTGRGINKLRTEQGIDRLQIRRQIGFIGHQSFLYDNLTAEENLKFYARMYHLKDATDRLKNILTRVGLLERKNDLVRTFSRGMQQRLSIGRALLTDPKIILLDEPFSGLDQNAIENFVNLFTSLVSTDRIIIMTTHDLQLGLKLASHFAIISKGRMVRQGLTRSIDLHQFKKLYRKFTDESVALCSLRH